MKAPSIAYLTGITGTVAPVLAQTLNHHGFRIEGRHCRVNHDEDIEPSLTDVASTAADIIIHLALGPIAWAKALAKYAYEHHLIFVYVSTASVYDDQGSGPYTVHSPVHAKQGYGLYKYQCEEAVKEVNPLAYIVRIGWQIDPKQSPVTNNMFRFFAEQIKQQGKISVSSKFFPSCSFLPDTTEAMYQMIQHHPPGLYFINGNHRLSLHDIAIKLKRQFQLSWTIEATDDFNRNDLLIDQRLPISF